MTKNLLLALLASASLLASSCGKDTDADPQPLPVAPIQEATLNVSFQYTGSADTRKLSYQADKPTGQQLPDRLVLTFANLLAPTTSDKVIFTLPASRQKNGLVGTYTLASQPDPSLGDVKTTFFRYSSSGGSYMDNYVDSNSDQLTGTVKITGYDAARRLISGTYEVSAAGIRDPFTFRPNPANTPDARPTGDLRVSGAFTEIPLQ